MESKLVQNVIQWAKDKNLNDPVKQTLKVLSEAGELADAVCKSNLEDNPDVPVNEAEIIDAIGDIEITLIILKNQLGYINDHPLSQAWEVIKNRTGKTINGTFVKD